MPLCPGVGSDTRFEYRNDNIETPVSGNTKEMTPHATSTNRAEIEPSNSPSNVSMSPISNRPRISPASKAKPSENEVDYYFNPTELFRWINYRRWDGAKARALSHPDECATWIVSRHSSDGRVLWRHLPLHLVCMQATSGDAGENKILERRDATNEKNNIGLDGKHSSTNFQQQRQIEDLIETLIKAYPQAVSLQDDQGMLPLHLCVSSAGTSNKMPNERIINSLLILNPIGIETKDKYGRTPIDMLREKDLDSPEKERILCTMVRVKDMMEKIVNSVKEENAQAIEAVKQWSENERKAHQRIIIRLEQELADEQRKVDDAKSSQKKFQEECDAFRDDIHLARNKIADIELDLDQVRKERDELVSKNEILGNKLDSQGSSVAQIKREAEKERSDQASTIASLKSEINTARAMAEAMEAQLRSRFTNEEFLTTAVSELEKKLKTMTKTFQQEKKKLLHDNENLEEENTLLKKSVEDLTGTNRTLQARNSDLNKYMGNILNSYAALNEEHDRMMDSASKHEEMIRETTKSERRRIILALEKQRELFDSELLQQKRVLEEISRKEDEIRDTAREERKSGEEVIVKMRKEFQEMRALATEKELKTQQNTLLANLNRVSGRSYETEIESTIQNNSDSIEPTCMSVNQSQGANVGSKKFTSPGIMRMTDRNSPTFSTLSGKKNGPSQSSHRLYSNHIPKRQPQTERSDMSRRHSQNPTQSQEIQGPQSSTGLLSILEERAAQTSSVSGNSNINTPLDMRNLSSASNHSSATPSYSPQTPGQHAVTFAPPKTYSQPTSAQLSGGRMYSNTPPNSSSVIRNVTREDNVTDTSSQNQHSVTDTSSHHHHRGLSLDEYSENSDSAMSGSTNTTTKQEGLKPYPGMTAGLKKGTIRVRSPAQCGEDDDNSLSMESLRRRYGIDVNNYGSTNAIDRDVNDTQSIATSSDDIGHLLR